MFSISEESVEKGHVSTHFLRLLNIFRFCLRARLFPSVYSSSNGVLSGFGGRRAVWCGPNVWRKIVQMGLWAGLGSVRVRSLHCGGAGVYLLSYRSLSAIHISLRSDRDESICVSVFTN